MIGVIVKPLQIYPWTCALLIGIAPGFAVGQNLTPDDALAALIERVDAVLAAGLTPEASAAILGSTIAPPGGDPAATLLTDVNAAGRTLTQINVVPRPDGTSRISFEVGGACIASQTASGLFPAAQWAPYPDRDPHRFNQLVETRVGSTIRLTFRLADGCLAAIAAETAPA